METNQSMYFSGVIMKDSCEDSKKYESSRSRSKTIDITGIPTRGGVSPLFSFLLW